MGSGLARHKKRKHSWNPYTSEIQRLSIYPRVRASGDEFRLKPGMEITVVINDMGDRGQGIASYRGYKVYIYNASVGSKVRVRITRVQGSRAYGEIVETLSESSIEY